MPEILVHPQKKQVYNECSVVADQPSAVPLVYKKGSVKMLQPCILYVPQMLGNKPCKTATCKSTVWLFGRLCAKFWSHVKLKMFWL